MPSNLGSRYTGCVKKPEELSHEELQEKGKQNYSPEITGFKITVTERWRFLCVFPCCSIPALRILPDTVTLKGKGEARKEKGLLA